MKRRPQNRKTPQRHGRDKLPAAPIRKDQAPTLSAGRKWAFRLIALVCIPLLALGGLEGALRLAGYGYNTSFFDTSYIGHQRFLVDNENFSLRFFPPAAGALAQPHLDGGPQTHQHVPDFRSGRIGGQGRPEPAYGAARYLEVLLRERYPDEHFEVINVAITAINSNVILPIARACARQDGDLWIIYMGNNEMVGPFGAATVFGAKAPPWWLIRLNLAVQQTRVGQLITSLARKLRNNTDRGLLGRHADVSRQSTGTRRSPTGNRLSQLSAQPAGHFAGGLHSGVKNYFEYGRGEPQGLSAVRFSNEQPPIFRRPDAVRRAARRSAPTSRQKANSPPPRNFTGRRPNWTPPLPNCSSAGGNVCWRRISYLRPATISNWPAMMTRCPFRADSRINELIRAGRRKISRSRSRSV